MKKLLLLSFLLCLTSSAEAASFDCARAFQHIEWVICHDPEVSALDEVMIENYQEALARSTDVKAMKAYQKNWVSKVRDGCMTPRCLKEIYQAHIKKLQSIGTESSESQLSIIRTEK